MCLAYMTMSVQLEFMLKDWVATADSTLKASMEGIFIRGIPSLILYVYKYSMRAMLCLIVNMFFPKLWEMGRDTLVEMGE